MCKLARFRDSILVSNRPALTPSFSKDCVASEAAALTKIFSNFLSGCDRVEWPANKSVRGGFGKELGILKSLSKSQSAERVKASLPEVLRVSDAGQRHRRDIHQWPASESRQGKNPRGMGRGECRALRYGDLADAEGVSAGAPCPLRRFVAWQVGSDGSG